MYNMSIGFGIFLFGLLTSLSLFISIIFACGTILSLKKNNNKEEINKIKQDLKKINESVEYIEEMLASLNVSE